MESNIIYIIGIVPVSVAVLLVPVLDIIVIALLSIIAPASVLFVFGNGFCDMRIFSTRCYREAGPAEKIWLENHHPSDNRHGASMPHPRELYIKMTSPDTWNLRDISWDQLLASVRNNFGFREFAQIQACFGMLGKPGKTKCGPNSTILHQFSSIQFINTQPENINSEVQ